MLQRSYHIAFANRKEFESAWPHILKLKSKGAPVTLLRGPHVYVWTARPPKSKTAGVIIRCGQSKGNVIGIELVVDGEIVNMNRIMSLPPDTPIIDKRVKDKNGK